MLLSCTKISSQKTSNVSFFRQVIQFCLLYCPLDLRSSPGYSLVSNRLHFTINIFFQFLLGLGKSNGPLLTSCREDSCSFFKDDYDSGKAASAAKAERVSFSQHQRALTPPPPSVSSVDEITNAVCSALLNAA